ncbi:YncE family protein [Mycolicibacterium phlei]|uniref:YncE family protein n=1 Tax=Mycolicibacterium phlei TaxID=1771 RepID=UPI0037C8F874
MVDFSMPAGALVTEHDRPADPAATVLGSVDVRRGAVGDIAGSSAGAILTTHPGDDSVALLNGRTLAVEAIIAVPGEPVAIATHGNRAYVSTSSWTHKDEVTVIDTVARRVLARYPLADSITALAVSPDGQRVFAGRTGDGSIAVSVIDTVAERARSIEVATGAGIGIDALAVAADGRRLHIATTDARGSAVLTVDVETGLVESAASIGAPIRDLAVADGTAYVLTSDRTRGGVVHIVELSTGRIAGIVELGGAPTQLAMGADKSRVYVVDYDQVLVVCTLSLRVVNTIVVDGRPSCGSVNAQSGRCYVADYDGRVTAFGVDTTAPLTYSEFVASNALVSDIRDLEPVTA